MRIGLLMCACLAIACSASQPSSTVDSGAPIDSGPVAPTGVEGCAGGQTAVHNYPPGPYGINPGDTVADFCLQGYLSPTAQTLVPMALHDYFDWAGTSGNSILFLSAGMTWCSPCNSEALQLPKASTNVTGQGATIFQVLLDGPTYGVGATEEDLKAWDTKYKLPFWEAMDPTRVTADYFPTPHPPGLIIDMKTMHVLAQTHGYETAAQLTTRLTKCVSDPSACQ